MPIRSQLDTSYYGRYPGRNTSLGEIMGAVQGVANMARSSKENRKKEQEEEDLRYVNAVTGKYMQGYSGNDPNDLYQRKQGAYNEILQTRPELNRYTAPMQEGDMKGQFTANKNALELEGDRVTVDNNKELLEGNKRTNIDAETKRKIERAMGAAQQLADVQDDFGYNKVLADYSDVLGKISPDYENYGISQDPATAFWRNQAGQVKQKKLMQAQKEIEDRDILMREKEAGITQKGIEAKHKGAQSADLYSQIKKRQWDMDNPKKDPNSNDTPYKRLSGFNAPETLADAGMSLGYFNGIRDMIDNGGASFWDRGLVGALKNPAFKKAYEFLAESVGREKSGAAISKSEWKVFKGLVADPALMVTDAGRAVVSKMLEEWATRTYVKGVAITQGNKEWYNDYRQLGTDFQTNYYTPNYGSGTGQPAQPKVTDDDIIMKYTGGK